VCPLATAEEVVIIVELEDRHPSWGPQKLARLLARRLGSTAPSPSTIARVLRRLRKVERRRFPVGSGPSTDGLASSFRSRPPGPSPRGSCSPASPYIPGRRRAQEAHADRHSRPEARMTAPAAAPRRKSRLGTWIAGAMVVGIVTGHLVHVLSPDAATTKTIAGYFSLLTDIFLRLIKMVIAPLVFSTLVAGMAGHKEGGAGRIGMKAMGWFLTASVVSLLLGLLLVNVLQPGHNLGLPLPPADATTNLKTTALNLKDFVAHLVPRSFFEAMAGNEILQILVFSIFFGAALSAFKDETAATITKILQELVHVMLKLTAIVMLAAPLGVFGAIASAIAVQGLGVLATYGRFIASFYLGLAALWLVLFAAGWVVLRGRALELVRRIREPMMIAFSTSSSEAAYPKTMEALERFGVSERITGFVLPLGYSFNLDGSMMYQSFAVIFIAQAYGIHLPISTQLTMLAVLMVTSKGIAGVARASLVVVAATAPMFNLPEAGLLLIMGIDQFLDMGRTATNVLGNSIAAAVVARWERALGPATPETAPEAVARPVVPAAG
jgi:Na+/H+-dicarboxylate symporter